MSIIAKLNEELTRTQTLASPAEPQTLTVPAGEGRVARLTVASVDVLACQFTEIAVHCDSAVNWSAKQNQSISNALSSRLQYLLEPVSPVEFDETSAILQMRSNPPSRDEEGGREYYELTTDRTGVCLVRYHKVPATRRTRVPMTLTREVVGRLVNDLTAAVSMK